MNRKIILILSFVLITGFQNAFAQFSIVQDADKYVNVRGEHNKIIDKVPTGTIVWEAMPDYNWSGEFNSRYAAYTKGDKIYLGNIHSSRLKDINTFTEIHKKEIGNLIIFEKDSTIITLQFKALDKNRCCNTTFEDVSIRINKNEFSLPQSYYNDLKNLTPTNYTKAYCDEST